MAEQAELSVPLLLQQEQEQQDAEQEAEQEIRSAAAAAAAEPHQQQQHDDPDLETGLLAADHGGSSAASEANVSSKSEDDAAAEAAARASHLLGPSIYFGDLLRLCIFYWAIVSDALLMKELYVSSNLALAGVSTGFTVGSHVIMSLLLIVRQGWLAAAGQACGFILTLNPFEALMPIPQGIVGLFVLSVGFIAYVLIAASGLIFVLYCVVCYLVTALLFSLLILDLAALVITVAPSKAIFKYTDLVYTENFKFSRLVMQAWLQSAPELVLLGVILYRNASPGGPAVVVPAHILFQALAAHLLNFIDKSLLFRSSAAVSGCSTGQQLLLLLSIKGSARLSLPVLKENLSRVLRGAGGSHPGGLGSVLHISCYEEVPDTESDAAASMVPEYLTPQNGGLLSPAQAMGLSAAVFGRYGGPEVAELVLELTPEVMVGKMLSHIAGTVPNISSVRIVNGSARGADAAAMTSAMLQWSSLRTLQLHQVVIDEQGARALTQLLEATPTLQQLELCRCELRRKAAGALAQGLRVNKTLRQLNLAGIKRLDEAGACALAAAVACSKVLTALNLAFVNLSMAAVDSLVQAINSSSSLRVIAVTQTDLPLEGASKLVAAITALTSPKAPPSLSCNLNLGTFPVQGLDGKLQFLVVQDQDALLLDAWQSLAGPQCEEGCALGGGFSTSAAAGGGPSAAAAAAARDGSLSEGSSGSSPQECTLLLPSSPTRGPRQHGEIGSSSSSHQHAASPAVFGVVSSPSIGLSPTAAAALLPRASAAWFSGGSGGSGSNLASVASFTQAQEAPAARLPAPAFGTGGGGGASSSGGGARASSSKAACAGPSPSLVCPCLVLVVVQDDCVTCMAQAPLLFRELDTLDLAGLGVADEGAATIAKTLAQNPPLRRCILADNRIGEEGGAALADALAVNTSLQVLDLSANEFSEDGVAALADAASSAAGLRQLRLLGNKIPFGLDTLRKLMQAEASNPQCRLVLVEDPAEVLDELEAAGNAILATRAEDFYRRQESYRQQRRQRLAARRQRLARIQQRQDPGDEAAAADGAAPAGGSTPDDEQHQQEPQEPRLQIITHPAAPGSAASSGGGGDGSPDAAAAATAAEAAAAASPLARAGSSCGASPRGGGGGSTSASAISSDEDTCGICFDNSNHVAIKYCGHRLCVDCYRKVWDISGAAATCPFCRAKIESYVYLDWPLALE